MTLARANAHRLPIRPGSVDLVVTSIPYLEHRTYGDHPDEIGHEPGLRAYTDRIADAFEELRGPQGALTPTGSLWLNIGDKANGSGGAGGDWTRNQPSRPAGGGARRFVDPDYELGTFLDVPGAVIAELLRRGWRLRLPIVWSKLTESRESLRHVGRPRWSHEMIYFLAPGPMHSDRKPRFFPSMLTETGSVWTFPPRAKGPKHLAPFPDELPRRCILAATLPGDVVLDPFDGAGTTRRVALELGRVGIGTDLYAGLNLKSTVAKVDPRPSTSTRRRPGPIPQPVVEEPGPLIAGVTTAAEARAHGHDLPDAVPGSSIYSVTVSGMTWWAPNRHRVDVGDLTALDLRPAVFYFACRRIAAGETLEDVIAELKLTDHQAAYLEARTRPDDDREAVS